jgi:hypothetical protein
MDFTWSLREVGAVYLSATLHRFRVRFQSLLGEWTGAAYGNSYV